VIARCLDIADRSKERITVKGFQMARARSVT
jgi:hypothetical protein